MDYFPFGAIRLDQQVAPPPGTLAFSEQRKYIGQEYDQDTGLAYLNARYYNATLARFISEDPQFWNFDNSWLADPQNQNSYTYARNNPITLSDPTGKDFGISEAIFALGTYLFYPTTLQADPVYEPQLYAQTLAQSKTPAIFFGGEMEMVGEGGLIPENLSSLSRAGMTQEEVANLKGNLPLVEHNGEMKPFFRRGDSFIARPDADFKIDKETGLINPKNSTDKFQGISAHVDPSHPNVAVDPRLVTEMPKGLQANASQSGHVTISPVQPATPTLFQSLLNIIKSTKLGK